MSEERNKPTAGFWITVALVALLAGYPLSFGPACWLASWDVGIKFKFVEALYWPILRFSMVDVLENESPIHSTIQSYAQIGARADSIGLELIFLRTGYDMLANRPPSAGCFQ